MHSTLKKIAAIICLLTMSMPLLFSFKFMLEEHLIEQEAEERMEYEELCSLTIPMDDIVWMRKDKEILIDGKHFDVKLYSINNGIATLTGYFDDEETKLLEEYKDITESEAGDDPLKDIAVKVLLTPILACQIRETTVCWQDIACKQRRFDEPLPVAPTLSFTHPPQS